MASRETWHDDCIAFERSLRFGWILEWPSDMLLLAYLKGVNMKHLFSCWLFSAVLALGISAPVLAGGDKGGHHHGGGDPTADISKSFGGLFLSPGKIGTEINRSFKFTVSSQSSFSAMILSFGIDDFLGTLSGRKGTTFFESFNIDDGRTTISALLEPGKYSFALLGTVADAPAAYFGGFSLAPVPEPAEWMMIIAGVAMMGFVVSRRRNIG